MILLLAGAGVLSAALGDVTGAVVIFVVVVLNTWIGFRQEHRAEKAMASLQAMATPTVQVVRGGTSREIPARELVAGDLVLLEAGSRVPAEGRPFRSGGGLGLQASGRSWLVPLRAHHGAFDAVYTRSLGRASPSPTSGGGAGPAKEPT